MSCYPCHLAGSGQRSHGGSDSQLPIWGIFPFIHPHKYRYQYEYIPQMGYMLPGSIFSSKAAAADAFEHLNEHFSQHQPWFHSSSLVNKQPVWAQKEMGSGSGTEERKKPHCKKSAFVPQGTTVPGRQQHLETSLGLLRKRKDKFMSASLGLSKPQLVEIMADLTTLQSSQHPIPFLQESGVTYPDMFA